MEDFAVKNNEIRALKKAMNDLGHIVSDKIVEATRKFFRSEVRYQREPALFNLVLGRKYCRLLALCEEHGLFDSNSAVDLNDYNPLKLDGTVKLWGLPIFVSKENDTAVEIVIGLGRMNFIDQDFLNFGEPLNKSLIDLDELVAALPEENKVKPAPKIDIEAKA